MQYACGAVQGAPAVRYSVEEQRGLIAKFEGQESNLVVSESLTDDQLKLRGERHEQLPAE